jgi:hypothetical protein
MPLTDILKLIFHHDQRMDNLAPSSNPQADNPLAMFMQPDPTYSTLYFSGTDLASQKFGLNTLHNFDGVTAAISEGLNGFKVFTQNQVHANLQQAIDAVALNGAIVLAPDDIEPGIIHSFSNRVLRDVLEKGWVIVFKREAQDGFDLHLFSKANLYTHIFYPLQKMLPHAFRFFSINGKRLKNESQFYFENSALTKPPHGFEEVFPESVL